MAGERQLFIRSEDAYAVISQGIGRGKQKSCFGQVRPIGESLNVFGAQAVGKALNPVDATSDVKSVRLALMENSDMGEGNPLPVDPQDNHAAHAPQHLMPIEVIVDAFSQTGRIDPNGLIALQNAIPHLEAHFEYLKADKLQEALFKQLWPRFTAAKSGAEGVFRMVERMQQNTQQGGSPTPPGGLDPAAQVGATTLQ